MVPTKLSARYYKYSREFRGNFYRNMEAMLPLSINRYMESTQTYQTPLELEMSPRDSSWLTELDGELEAIANLDNRIMDPLVAEPKPLMDGATSLALHQLWTSDIDWTTLDLPEFGSVRQAAPPTPNPSPEGAASPKPKSKLRRHTIDYHPSTFMPSKCSPSMYSESAGLAERFPQMVRLVGINQERPVYEFIPQDASPENHHGVKRAKKSIKGKCRLYGKRNYLTGNGRCDFSPSSFPLDCLASPEAPVVDQFDSPFSASPGDSERRSPMLTAEIEASLNELVVPDCPGLTASSSPNMWSDAIMDDENPLSVMLFDNFGGEFNEFDNKEVSSLLEPVVELLTCSAALMTESPTTHSQAALEVASPLLTTPQNTLSLSPVLTPKTSKSASPWVVHRDNHDVLDSFTYDDLKGYPLLLCDTYCSRCNYRFVGNYYDVALHMKSHPNYNRPTRCCIPDCPLSILGLESVVDLRFHYANHHYQKCVVNPTFAPWDEEMRKVMFNCDVDPNCNKCFARQDSLRRHMRLVHRLEAPAKNRRPKSRKGTKKGKFATKSTDFSSSTPN